MERVKYEWYAMIEHSCYGCVIIKGSVKPTKAECRDVVKKLRMEDYVTYRKHRMNTELPLSQIRFFN